MNNKQFKLGDFKFTGPRLNPDNVVFRERVASFEEDLALLKDESLDFTEKEEIKTRVWIQFEVLKLMIAKTVMETELPLLRA